MICDILKTSIHRHRIRSGDRVIRFRFDKFSTRVRVATRGKDSIRCPHVYSVVNSIRIDHRMAGKVFEESCWTVPAATFGKVEHVVRVILATTVQPKSRGSHFALMAEILQANRSVIRSSAETSASMTLRFRGEVIFADFFLGRRIALIICRTACGATEQVVRGVVDWFSTVTPPS